MADISARQQHLFIVRLWHEPSQIAPPGQWRGSVEHTSSGRRRYFTAFDALVDFVAAQLGDAQLAMQSAADSNIHSRTIK
jgi:hypothetical protein